MVQAWKTVRIFISSTFRDMHAERDHLVKVVFPELRERCVKRQMHLIDIDLRWGVTEEEAEQGKVLEICLDEIERSRPFFIGLLGERYGFIPKNLPEDAEFAHPWLRDYASHSLTALEIIHGVLRNPDMAKHSFFYFRDPAFISLMPESKRGDFVAENEEASSNLTSLKDSIRLSGRSVMENYPCRWDDAKQSVVDLDVFGQQVLEELWTAICTEYPEDAPEPDPLDIERQIHEAFAEERSHHHVGRKEQAAKLTEHVQGKDRRPVVITGESGCGKSAYLASWYRKYTSENPDDFVLAYFIGASPASANHHRLLRNMCEELKRKFALKEEIPEDDKKLSETLVAFLLAASGGEGGKLSFWNRLLHRSPKMTKDRRIVIMLDALDQLSPIEGAHGLGWLLDYLPEKVRLVVSSLEGDCLEVLRRREAEEILLPPLTENEQRQIVQALLGEWRRRLDDKQMEALLAHPGVKNPLYLRVALEELRLFGSFEQLTARIQSLAEDIPGLFDQVLARLEEDHGRTLVMEAFALLGCSRYGLSEAEMLDLLSIEGKQFPRALWARLSRSARSYIVQRGELIGFFHRQLADAVEVRYLSQEKKHTKLAAYFEHAPLERKLDEYPYQLQHAEQWQSLAAALSDLNFFEYAWDHNRKYEWMGYWRSLKGRFEPGKCYQAAIEAREKTESGTMGMASLLYKIGWLLHDMALYPSALLFYERALAMREKAVGYKHLDVATPMYNLAELYQDQGKFAEAELLFKRAMAIYKKSLGPDHATVAASQNRIARLYFIQGKYAAAESLHKGALPILEKALGPDNPYVAESLNNLANLYCGQGKYAEAEPLYRRSLVIYEKALGPDHPQVAGSLNDLAGLYQDQSKYEEAEPLHKRALAIKEKALGPDHPSLAASLDNLANIYRTQGKYAEAEPLYRRALALLEKAHASDHPDVAKCLNNLAELYNNQGKYAEAEPLHKRALAIKEKALGPDHPSVAASLDNLANLYYVQGKYAEAKPLYRRELALLEKALGFDHPDVANCLNDLANLYYAQGKYAEAEPLYMRALAIYEKAFGPDHATVAATLNNLAGLYKSQGKYAEAEPLYRRAVSIAETALEPQHPSTDTIKKNLKSCKDAMRRS